MPRLAQLPDDLITALSRKSMERRLCKGCNTVHLMPTDIIEKEYHKRLIRAFILNHSFVKRKKAINQVFGE